MQPGHTARAAQNQAGDHASPTLASNQTNVATPVGRWSGRIKQVTPFLLILILALSLLTININQPWISLHEDNGLLFSSIAINQLRFGLSVTKGQGLTDTEVYPAPGQPPIPGPPEQVLHYLLTGPIHPLFYANHPPLLGLTIAGAFVLFGVDFWVVRLVPLLYSLATLLLVYVLAVALFDVGIARFASFLYATFPMLAYFGRNVAHESPTLFWALLLLSSYLQWLQTRRTRWLTLSSVSIVIGGCYDWPIFYFAGILLTLDWIASRRLSWRLAAASVVPALLTLLLVVAHIVWALGGNLAVFLHAFFIRVSGPGIALTGDPSAHISALGWLSTMLGWNVIGFGLWSLFVMPLVLFFLVKQARSEGWSPRIRVLAMTGLFGLSHVLIFREGAYVHLYWQFYCLPFYSLSIGWALVTWVRRYARSPVPAFSVIGTGILALNLPLIYALYSSISGVFVPLFGLWAN